MKLTARMRDALEQARHAPLRRVLKPGPGAPSWPAHPGTLHALERREFLARGEIRNRDGWPVTTWTITDTGRQALEPIERTKTEAPVYLRRPASDIAGDYTSDPRARIDDAEVTDPDRLNEYWAQDAAERHAATEDPRARARRLTGNTRAWRTSRPDDPAPVRVRHTDPADRRPGRRAA
jgi:hypothetical protein